jgi:hypothetical protein
MFAFLRAESDEFHLHLPVFAHSPRSVANDEEVLSSCTVVKQLRVAGFEGKLTCVRL